jgi:RimJ/RimL family protein N-acetyltransferase
VSTDGIEHLETERMVLERLRPGDEEALARVLGDPRVAEWVFPDRAPPEGPEISANLARHLEHWGRNGFGLWLLRDRATAAVVGRGGLLRQRIDGRDEVEVGWSIVPERWGQGLATELARAAITVAFDRLRVEQLVSFTLPHNAASRRVMEKAGFAFEREFEHVGLPHVLYRRRRW